MPQIPSNISITNDGAIRVEESRKVIFEGPHVHMVTDTGVEVFADYAQADMDQGKVFLKGNLAIYQGDGRTRTNSLVRADSAEFDLSLIHIWKLTPHPSPWQEHSISRTPGPATRQKNVST